MNIALFVGSLDTGGAQRQFAQLADALAACGHDVTMIASVPQGQNWDWLAARNGTRLVALHRPSTSANKAEAVARLLATPNRLYKALRETRPDVLYTALYLSNLLGWTAARRLNIPVVWGLRASQQDLGWKRRVPYDLCRRLAARIPLAIANSKAGLDSHRATGFRFGRTVVIPNGIDTTAFYRDRVAGRELRRAWKVPDTAPLVGLPGRLAPKKGHRMFLRAAAALGARQSDLRFVCIGDGPPAFRDELHRFASELGLNGRAIWAGGVRDMRAVYGALDVACCPSLHGEGFPNVVAEAMACEVQCVASSTGDTAWVMGPHGFVVAPGDVEALAAGIEQALEIDAKPAGAAARRHIVDHFSVERLIRHTETELLSVLARARPAARTGTGPAC